MTEESEVIMSKGMARAYWIGNLCWFIWPIALWLCGLAITLSLEEDVLDEKLLIILMFVFAGLFALSLGFSIWSHGKYDEAFEAAERKNAGVRLRLFGLISWLLLVIPGFFLLFAFVGGTLEDSLVKYVGPISFWLLVVALLFFVPQYFYEVMSLHFHMAKYFKKKKIRIGLFVSGLLLMLSFIAFMFCGIGIYTYYKMAVWTWLVGTVEVLLMVSGVIFGLGLLFYYLTLLPMTFSMFFNWLRYDELTSQALAAKAE